MDEWLDDIHTFLAISIKQTFNSHWDIRRCEAVQMWIRTSKCGAIVLCKTRVDCQLRIGEVRNISMIFVVQSSRTLKVTTSIKPTVQCKCIY